jgi:release factor glutamine methyltransferase
MTEWHPLRSVNDVDSSSWKSLNASAERRAKLLESAEMPSMDHATMQDFGEVYEPSDDTYLLIDGIKADLMENPELNPKARTAVELGSGSGVPIVYLASSLESCTPIATDINPKALALTQKTANANNVKNLETMQCDLASGLLPKYEKMVDFVIFNPPYVPTPDEEVSGNGIEASWAGGERGRRVIDRAIPQIAQLLARPSGVCYMITVDDNEPEEIARKLSTLGLSMSPLVRRRAHNEYLTVQKIVPTTDSR